MGNFNALTWQGKDSLITSLFSGGAQSLAFVFIDHAYNFEKSRPESDPKAMTIFSHWKGIRYLAENLPDSASIYLSECLDLYDAYPEIKDSLYTHVLVNAFISANSMGEFSNALRYLKIATDYLESSGYTGSWRMENMLRLVEYEILYGSADSAEIEARHAISFAADNFGNKSPEYLVSLSLLGRAFQSQGRIRQAANLILQAYSLSKVQLDSNHIVVAELGHNAAGIQRDVGKDEEALTIYRELLDRFNQYPDMQESELYPETLTRVGLLYQNMGDFDEAYEYLSRADILITLRREKYDPVYINSQVNMGDVLLERNQFIEAEQYYQGALEQTLESYGDVHEAASFIYNKLGNLYHTGGQLDEALNAFNISKDIMIQIYGNDHPSYGAVLKSIAGVYQDMGNDSLAFENLEETYFVLHDKYYGFNPEIFELIHALSRLEPLVEREKQKYLLEGVRYINNSRNVYRFLPLAQRNYIRKQIEEYLSFSCIQAFNSNGENQELIDELYSLNNLMYQIDWMTNPVDLIPFAGSLASNFSKTALEWQQQVNSIVEMSATPGSGVYQDYLDSLKTEADTKLGAIFPHTLSQLPQIPEHPMLSIGDAMLDISLFYPSDSVGQAISDEPSILIFSRTSELPEIQLTIVDLDREKLSGNDDHKILLNEELAFIIWQHIEKLVTNTRRIFINSRSTLFWLPLETMRDSEGQFVTERYEIVRIADWSSLQNPSIPKSGNTGLAISNCSFDGDPKTEGFVSTPDGEKRLWLDLGDSSIMLNRTPSEFSGRMETSERIGELTERLKKKKWQIDELTGINAKEDKFRNQLESLSPHLLILDVQFFNYIDFEGLNTSAFKNSALKANHLLRSGFALSGANNSMNGTSFVDGLIPNIEFATLPVQNVDLAVIVFDFNESISLEEEDLFYLFPNTLTRAGVNNILLVNRKTSISVIREFFNFFSKKYLKNGSVLEGYHSGVARLKKKHTPGPLSGFILIQ